MVPVITVIVAVLICGVVPVAQARPVSSEIRPVAKAPPPSAPGPPSSVFYVPNPVSLAVTPTELLATSWHNCTGIVSDEDSYAAPFASVPLRDTACTQLGIAISPGFAGFPKGDVYAGQGGYIFQIGPHGKPVTLFATVPDFGTTTPYPTGLTFDTVGSWGFDLVMTGGPGGSVCTLTASASLNCFDDEYFFDEQVYGPAVAPLSFGGSGGVGGDLVATTGPGTEEIVAISPTGEVDYNVGLWDGASSVAFDPTNLCDFQGEPYFVADNNSSEVLAFDTADVSPFTGQAFVTSANNYTGSGVGNLTGAESDSDSFAGSYYPAPYGDSMWASAFVSCPVYGITQEITNGNWNPYEMAWDPSSNEMYVTDNMSDHVWFFNSAGTVSGPAIVGTDPTGVVYDPASNAMLVSNSGSDNVSVFDASTNAVVGSVAVGGDPEGLAYDPVSMDVYVADNGTSNLTLIAPNNQTVGSATVGSNPFGVAFDATNGYIYTANYGETVSVVSGTTLVTSYTVSGPALGIVQKASNGKMFATIWNDSQVARIGGKTVLAYLPAGLGAFSIAWDPSDHYLYVSNHADGTLTVIKGPNTIIATIVVGEDPWGLAYDPVNKLMYVAGPIIGDPRSILGGGG